MDSDFCDSVDADYNRKVYTSYINSAVQPENNTYRDYSTLDDFPTTLAAMGVNIDGDRLGLGSNLFSSTPTLIERFGVDSINGEFSKNSKFMEEMTSDIKSDTDLEISQEEDTTEEETQSAVTADISATSYDYHTGLFKVNVDNLVSETDLQAVRCAVWSSEDQSDLQWYEAEPKDDDTYVANVLAKDFDYHEGDYHVDVYASNADGENLLIGSINAEI